MASRRPRQHHGQGRRQAMERGTLESQGRDPGGGLRGAAIDGLPCVASDRRRQACAGPPRTGRRHDGRAREGRESCDRSAMVGAQRRHRWARNLRPCAAGAGSGGHAGAPRASGMITKMQESVREILSSGAELTDHALDRLLPGADQAPVSIHRAMRHSVFAGGKRLRPVLCLEAARMIAASDLLPQGVEELGAAIEMLHTYSLIHDDLPALDDDDLRRGKPTCHVAFGEAIAIFAGCALQRQAYVVLARMHCPPAATVEIVRSIAQATGTVEGMIGGQVMDLEAEEHQPTAELVEAIHRAKTGALIRVSLVAGGIYAGGTAEDIERLWGFGRKAGLAFQIMDDVLDVTQNSSQLGKTAGKDVASEKATWPAVYGVEQSIKDAEQLIDEAFAQLNSYGERADRLKALARYLVERKN